MGCCFSSDEEITKCETCNGKFKDFRIARKDNKFHLFCSRECKLDFLDYYKLEDDGY